MWYFSSKAKLLRTLSALVYYNDKGAERAKEFFATRGENADAAIEAYRQAYVAKIARLIEKIGKQNFSDELLKALADGKIANDMTGYFLEIAKANLERS